MKINSPLKTIVCLALTLAASFSTVRAASTGIDAKTAFARMKSLSGDWTGSMMGQRMNMNFRVIAGGSAVLLTCLPGTPNEMITVYYIANNKLVQTHYCMLGNQPHMRLNAKKSNADTLVFDFAGGDNIKSTNMNMHAETLHLVGKNKIESTCTSQTKGKPSQSHTMTLVRK